MESPELMSRLSEVENKLESDRKARHEQNSKIIEVIDSMRVDQSEDRDRIKDVEREVKLMAESVRDLIGAIQGSMGFDGLVVMIKSQAIDIANLKAWRDSVRGWIAGWICAAGLLSGLVVYGLDKLL